MDDYTKLPSPDEDPEDYSITNLLGMADSTKKELNIFRNEVLRNFALARQKQSRWVNGYMACKMLCVTERTLRRYRIKYKLRIKMINGICRYYVPDLAALLKDPDKLNYEKPQKTF